MRASHEIAGQVRNDGNGNYKSFISYWIATGLQRALRNDEQNHDNGNGK
jgi:hypothetical protein